VLHYIPNEVTGTGDAQPKSSTGQFTLQGLVEGIFGAEEAGKASKHGV